MLGLPSLLDRTGISELQFGRRPSSGILKSLSPTHRCFQRIHCLGPITPILHTIRKRYRDGIFLLAALQTHSIPGGFGSGPRQELSSIHCVDERHATHSEDAARRIDPTTRHTAPTVMSTPQGKSISKGV